MDFNNQFSHGTSSKETSQFNRITSGTAEDYYTDNGETSEIFSGDKTQTRSPHL